MFDQELIAQVVAAGMAGRIGEIAVPTRYFEEASSVGFRRSVVYGLSTLRVVARYVLHRLRVRRSPKLVARDRAGLTGRRDVRISRGALLRGTLGIAISLVAIWLLLRSVDLGRGRSTSCARRRRRGSA